MSAPTNAYTYKGRPIEGLSRDELLVALQWAYSEIADERRRHREYLDMERMFEDARQHVGRVQRAMALVMGLK